MNKWKIYFVGLLGCFGDAASSWICSQHPELKETNPLANPFLEATTVLGSQALILHLGEKLKIPKSGALLSLAASTLPYIATANNLALLSILHAKTINWTQITILYPE